MNRSAMHPPRFIPFQKYDNPLWFVTFGTFDRKSILNNEGVASCFETFGKRQALRGISIGRYVIMPDHVHLFIRLAPKYKLGATIGFMKKAMSNELAKNGVPTPHWQPSFFDHLLRSSESYKEKWEYVYHNPVRAGLVKVANQWPYSGEIVSIAF